MLKITKKNRQKYNKQLAMFMGVYSPGQLENWDYDLSWNCLMPVVEKIEGTEATYVEILGKKCEIQPILTSVKKDRLIWHKKIEITGTTKIDAVYEAVFLFVQWYDGIQKKKDSKK